MPSSICSWSLNFFCKTRCPDVAALQVPHSDAPSRCSELGLPALDGTLLVDALHSGTPFQPCTPALPSLSLLNYVSTTSQSEPPTNTLSRHILLCCLLYVKSLHMEYHLGFCSQRTKQGSFPSWENSLFLKSRT